MEWPFLLVFEAFRLEGVDTVIFITLYVAIFVRKYGGIFVWNF